MAPRFSSTGLSHGPPRNDTACMAKRRPGSDPPLNFNPFPSTFMDRPHSSNRFRPAPDADDDDNNSVFDYSWYGEPLPLAESEYFYNDEDEGVDDDEADDEGPGANKEVREDPTRRFLAPQSPSLIYTAEGFTPNPYHGPVAISRSGNRWTLVASDVIEESNLVLISGEPLAHLAGIKPITLPASSADLHEAVASSSLALEDLTRFIGKMDQSEDIWMLNLTNPAQPLLRGLNNASTNPTPSLDMFLKPSVVTAKGTAPEIKPEVKKKTRRFASLFGKNSAGKLKPQKKVDSAIMKRIARENSVQGLHHDAASSLCRGEPLTPYGAIWPEVSLMDHSCLPNASLVTVGTGKNSRAVIRSTRTILPGEIITISRLSTFDLLSPLLARQAATNTRLEFICSCERCKVEESETPFLLTNLHRIHEAAISLRTQLAATLNNPRDFMGGAESSRMDEDEIVVKMCELVREDAQMLLKMFKDETEQLNQGTTKGLWAMIGAASFPIYELLAVCSQHIEGYSSVGHLSALNQALFCIDQVARGSELHTMLSTVLVKASQMLNGSMHSSTNNALRQSLEAHQLRYGYLENGAMAQLSSASLSFGSLLFEMRSSSLLLELRQSEKKHELESGPEEDHQAISPAAEEESSLAQAEEAVQTDSWGIPILRTKS